jgi:hypothetical protein
MDFYDLEKVFLYRDIVLEFLYKSYNIPKTFTSIDLKQYTYTTIDDVADTLYNNSNLYWIILYFNPSLDVEKFYVKKNTDANQFISNKLISVYTNSLDMNYSTREIEKVFDMYYNTLDSTKLTVPLVENVYDIANFIVDKTQKIVLGTV